jgi:hypothetical protein
MNFLRKFRHSQIILNKFFALVQFHGLTYVTVIFGQAQTILCQMRRNEMNCDRILNILSW